MKYLPSLCARFIGFALDYKEYIMFTKGIVSDFVFVFYAFG